MSKTSKAVLALAVALLAVGVWQITSRSSTSIAPITAPKENPPPAATAEASPSAASAETKVTRDSDDRLAAEKRARRKAEEDAEELRSTVAPLANQVLVSLGTVSDIGKRAGAILPALAELKTLSARDRSELTATEQRRLLDLQRRQADLLGMLPEIAGFQDNPDEYASFFRSMVQQAAGLSDSQAGEVETYMRQRDREMIQLGLNTARQPTEEKQRDKWEDQRDEFNEDTSAGLRKLLPAGTADQAGITPQLMELLETDFDKATPQSAK